MSLTITKVPSRRCGVRWKAIIRTGSGQVVKTKVFDLKSNARAWGERLEADREVVRALGTEAARLTLSDLVKGDPPRRPAFAVSGTREWQVKWWLDRLGSRLLTDITVDEIRTALNEYGAGNAQVFIRGKKTRTEKSYRDTGRRRSVASVNRLRAQLAAIYRHARLEWGLMLESPLRAVPVRKETNQRKVFLSVDQAGKLLAAARASSWDRLYLLILMGIATGARRGTLMQLRWSDIDFEARTATVHVTKNGDPIILTFTPDVVQELQRFRQGGDVVELARFREFGDSLVFGRPGRPYAPFESRKPWHTALRDADFTPWKPGMKPDEGFRFHDLRHSTASFLAARGASLFQIGEVLGHRSSATTKRYSHLLVDAKRKLTDQVFGELLARTREA